MLSLGLHLTQIQPLLTITVIVHAAFESRCLNNQAYKDLPPEDRPRYRIVGIGSKDASTAVLGQTAIEHNEGFPLLFADLMAKKSVASSPSGTVFPPVEQSPERGHSAPMHVIYIDYGSTFCRIERQNGCPPDINNT